MFDKLKTIYIFAFFCIITSFTPQAQAEAVLGGSSEQRILRINEQLFLKELIKQEGDIAASLYHFSLKLDDIPEQLKIKLLHYLENWGEAYQNTVDKELVPFINLGDRELKHQVLKEIHLFIRSQMSMTDDVSQPRYNDDPDSDFRDPSEVSTGVPFPKYPRSSTTRTLTQYSRRKFSAQVKLEFLGSTFTSGPMLHFEKRYIISTRILAPGEAPIIIQKGAFTLLNHRPKDQGQMVYLCYVEAQANVTTELGGSLKILGVGGEIQAGEWESIKVARSAAPAYVPVTKKNGQNTSLEDVTRWCNEKYLGNIKSNLDKELELTVKDLVYHNPLNQCAKDSDCYSWHRKRLWFVRDATTFTCATRTKLQTPTNYCTLRSPQGGACLVYRNGKLISSGEFEYPCANGLTCKMIKKGGFFSSAKGKCVQ